MDWGLFTITRKGRIIPRTRQRMSLPLYLYIFAAIINLILRFSWAANRIPQVGNKFSLFYFQIFTVSLVWNSFDDMMIALYYAKKCPNLLNCELISLDEFNIKCLEYSVTSSISRFYFFIFLILCYSYFIAFLFIFFVFHFP